MHILLVEDDEVEVEAVRRALRGLAETSLEVAGNGVEALERLRDRRDAEPLMVLLDINMPLMNGHEFLATLRADPRLRETIVFVLTTSSCTSDLVEAYRHKVAGYLIKGELDGRLADLAGFLQRYREVNSFPVRHVV